MKHLSFQEAMRGLFAAIVDDDRQKVNALLKTDAGLATGQVPEARLYNSRIFHWIYAGDTALHLAAAGYRIEVVRLLLESGADPNAATNHRRSTPLHYAADGFLSSPAWDPQKQVKTIQCLLDAGADMHSQDKNGATPLHRAVRTRSLAAVRCLLQAGSDSTLRNKSGSTPFHLAVQNTGRGGTGSAAAVNAQREIIHTFLALGLRPDLKNSKGKSVMDSAQSAWVRAVLTEFRPGA